MTIPPAARHFDWQTLKPHVCDYQCDCPCEPVTSVDTPGFARRQSHGPWYCFLAVIGMALAGLSGWAWRIFQ